MSEAFENLAANNGGEPSPLSKLHEIPLPENVSWLPQTLGWQLILLCFLAYVFYRVYLVYVKWLKNAYRREAVKYLNSLSNTPADIIQIPVILKQAALYGFDREEVSQLSGKDWEKWLDNHCNGVSFSADLAGILSHLAYFPNPNINNEKWAALKSQVTHWICNHGGRYG